MEVRAAPRNTQSGTPRGFTLLELMITVAIVAILASIALPSFSDYLLRGRLMPATAELAAMRIRMEQYYLDNRTYANAPCTTALPRSSSNSFQYDCRTEADKYTLIAKGSGPTDGFEFRTDQLGNQLTTKLPSRWGGIPNGSSMNCWVLRRGETC